jgi:curved DNA-binding protein CbpA
MTTRDLYRVLNLSRNATLGDIKSAYRKLALKLHPDVTKNDKILAEQFKNVNHAYDVLSDATQRKDYDHSVGIVRLHHEYDTLYKNKKVSDPSSTTNPQPGSGVRQKKYTEHTGPVYGYNDAEWMAWHYGVGDVHVQDAIRQTGRKFTDMPGNRHAAYYRRRAARNEERWRKILEEEGIFIDSKRYASDLLNRKRQARRSGKSQEDESFCTIS